MKCSLLIGVVMLLGAAVCRSEMQEGLNGERCLGRFGWNQSGSQVLRDGLLFNGIDENGLEACIGLGNNQFRMWRMDILTPEAPAQDPGVKVKWLNWIAKEVEVRRTNQNYNLTYSLASPGVIVDTAAKQLAFKLKADQIRYMAYQEQDKVLVKNISEMKEGLRGQDLKANWILCFSGQEAGQRDVPLLLVLTQSPAVLNVESNKVVLAGDIGRVIVALPFGLKTFDGKETESWGKVLPEEITQQCQFWSRTLLEYPVDCHEFYEVDEDNRAVKIEDRYEYLVIKDAWHTVAQKVAPMPPIISFARTEEYFKERVKVEDSVKDLGYPTWYGPLEGNIGKSAASYVLPCPYPSTIIPLRLPGTSPFTEFMMRTIEPNSPKSSWLGDRDLSGSLWMDEKVRATKLAATEKRVKTFFQNYDKFSVFFEEPSTKKGFYTFKIPISSQKDTGSFRIAGKRAYDMDAFVAYYLAPVYDYVLWSGDIQLLKDNWEKIEKAEDTFWVVNDWAIMSASESDAGSVNMNSVDCTWDVLASLEMMIGCARLSGNSAALEKAQYLWSRQLPVSMLKMALQWNYLPKYGCGIAENKFFAGVGEIDSRYTPESKGVSQPQIPYWVAQERLPWTFNNASVIWPSGGFLLLSEMAPGTTRKYIRLMDEIFPGFDDGSRYIPYRRPWWSEFEKLWGDGFFIDPMSEQTTWGNHLFLLAALGDDRAPARIADTFYRATFQEQWVFEDTTIHYALPRLLATETWFHSPVALGDWGTYKLKDGYYAAGTAKIDLESRDTSPLQLRCICRQEPLSVAVNGAVLERAKDRKDWRSVENGWRYQPGTLLVKAGNSPRATLEIKFGAFKEVAEPFQTAALEPGNLIFNPGFEITRSLMSYEVSGSATGDVVLNRWQSASPMSFYRKMVSSSEEQSRTGRKSAKLILDKETGFYQDLKGVPGAEYKASCYYLAPEINPDKEALRFSLSALKGGKIRQIMARKEKVVSKVPGPDWEMVSLSLRCPPDANIIRVQVCYQPIEDRLPALQKAVYLDDIILTKSEESRIQEEPVDVKMAEPDDQRLLFYASFDNGVDADYARGDRRAGIGSGLEAVVGHGLSGNCLSLATSVVSYDTEKNFNPQEGALSIWIKPDREFFARAGGKLWGGTVFWTEYDFTDYYRFMLGVILDVKNPDIFQAYAETECGALSDKERPTFRYAGTGCSDWDNWHQLAVTWKKITPGKDQTCFYFDGKPVKAFNDATLPPVVQRIMRLGHGDQRRQFAGWIDELRIYDRVLSPEEIQELYGDK